MDSKSEIDSADYALLNAVALDRWQAYLLAAENMDDLMNVEPHGLSEGELAHRFVRLWQRGLIECSYGGATLEGCFLEPDETLAHRQFDRSGAWPPPNAEIVFYGLTAAGGSIWEALASPNWHRYVREMLGNDKEFVISGANRDFVSQVFRLHHLSGSTIRAVPGTETWESAMPFHPTYWKALPSGHRVRCQSTIDSGPYYDCQEYREAAAEVGVLTRWCKSFQEVRDEHFQVR